MAELSGDKLEDTLIDCTNLRTLLSIHVTKQDADDVPEWQAFLEGLRSAEKPDEWAYQFYVKSEEGEPELDDSSGFGCFWYTYPFRDQPKVRLHFGNVDRSGHGALSLERANTRRAELTHLLKEIRARYPDAETVRGGSWLYNIDAYRRLFPTEYIASTKPVGYELQFWALWGQFLRGGGKINKETMNRFLDAIKQATSPEECETCFPYEVLRPECDIRHFYTHFGIE